MSGEAITKEQYEANPRAYWDRPEEINGPAEFKLPSLKDNPLWALNIFPEIILNEGRDLCLDLGCGGGRYIGLTAQNFKRVIGVDFSASNINHARRIIEALGIENVAFCLTALGDMGGIEDDSVDFAYSVAVFMHMVNAERRAALKELARVLKPEGRAVLIEITKLENSAFDCPELEPEEWGGMLEEAGLAIEEFEEEGKAAPFTRYKLRKAG